VPHIESGVEVVLLLGVNQCGVVPTLRLLDILQSAENRHSRLMRCAAPEAVGSRTQGAPRFRAVCFTAPYQALTHD
jgi:hypothetical protein